MGFFKEFKEFIMRGNVLDMAVGVIIGGAFGKIVTSLVNDIVMPPIGLAIGGVAFSELKATIKEAVPAVLAEDGETVVKAAKDAVTINYGNFIQLIIEFLIIALCIFLVVRTINKVRARVEEKKAAEAAALAAAEAEKAAAEAEAAAQEPAAPTEAELLAEIRDLLKKEKGEA